jgi:hypothetical protein
MWYVSFMCMHTYTQAMVDSIRNACEALCVASSLDLAGEEDATATAAAAATATADEDFSQGVRPPRVEDFSEDPMVGTPIVGGEVASG